MSKAVVTGAAGFVGSQLCEKLLNEGQAVLGIDALTDYYSREQKLTNVERLKEHSDFRFLAADAASATALAELQSGDVVYHLAGQPGVRRSWADQFEVYLTRNVQLTQTLLQTCVDRDVARFVFASSSSVYGNQESYPCDEAALPRPFSPYGVTKLAAEQLCSVYAENFGLTVASLRYFTVYGPRQRPDMAFSRFIRAALMGEAIQVTGDGTALRDFTFVDDIVTATYLAGTSELAGATNTIMNICGDETVSVREAISLIAEAVGIEPRVEFGRAVPGDVRQTGGSSTVATAVLNWRPTVSLRDGLRQQASWEALFAASSCNGSAGIE